MATKQNLLSVVQEILQALDSDNVNSIGDTDESSQVASIVRQVYYNYVNTREVPEHAELTVLESLADSTRPAMLKLPDNVRDIESIEYNIAEEASDFNYFKVKWKSPRDFLTQKATFTSASDSSDYVVMPAFHNSDVKIIARSDRHPTFYTSFDDEYLVFDAYKSTVEDTLQGDKTRCWAVLEPEFTLEDTFVMDADPSLFRMVVEEAKSTAIAILQKTINPKADQHARVVRYGVQNDKHRLNGKEYKSRTNRYGR